MSDLGFTRSDLRSIHAATQQPEFADAAQGRLNANGYPPAGDDPSAPMARAAARSLMAASFMLHHHDRHGPLHRLHGTCLLPVPAEPSGHRSASAVSSTTRDLLPDRDWRATCSRPCQPVNAMPGSVLHAVGYLDRQRGTVGTRFVADHRGERTEAGR